MNPQATHPASGRIALVLLLLAVAAACAGGPPAPGPLEISYDPSLQIDLEATEERSGGLLVQDLVEGTGEVARRGREVLLHYMGHFPDGSVFDGSMLHDEPARFRLGDGDVIPGWDQGIVGMREGGQRILIVPPRLAYGSQGVPGVIPGDQVVVFQIQLIEVR